MKKTFNVLSIDFDYFQDVDEDTIVNCYPDGKDLPSELTMMTWMTHYADERCYDKLMEIGIDAENLENIKYILLNQEFNTPCMTVQSHIHIYDFIKQHYNPKKYSGCNIVNIDMHHDCFNDNNKLDCGNWVSHAINDFENCKVSWIANKISKKVYGTEKLNKVIEHDFNKIQKAKFDLIFLCRSDTWLPPHLDPYFDELYKLIIENFYSTMVDPQITKPRDFEAIKSAAEEHRKQIAEYQKTLNELNKKGNTT